MLAFSQNFMNLLIRVITWIAIIVISALILLLVASIFSRVFFDMPILGTFEMAELMTLVIVYSTIPLTEKDNGHVKIDLFTSRLPQNLQDGLSFLMSFFVLAYILFLSWQGLVMAKSSYYSHQASSILDIPHYPFMLIISLGSFLFGLQIIANMFLIYFKKRHKGIKNDDTKVESDNGPH